MEVAAKKVQLLSQRILPEQPHQLAFAVDKRYRVGSDNTRGLEENVYRGLQYMTYVSDGDRGVLLTRSYDDMREEPLVTDANSSSTPARSDKKPSTKISLSDYKNKVKKQSQSPPQPTMTSRVSDEPRTGAPEARNNLDQKGKDISKAPREGKLQEVKSHGLREALLHDRPSSLPPKPPVPLRDARDSPDRRKRAAEEEDTTRPTKRTKPDTNGTTSHERAQTPKHEPIRNGGGEVARKRDASDSRAKSPRPAEGKAPVSVEVNGRSILKAAMASTRAGSPDSRPRATSLNGVRPNSSGGSKLAPHKAGATSSAKAAVPPLLSPLNLSFSESEAGPKGERKRKEEASEGRPAKAERMAGGSKKHEPPLPMPPLLSPTLPPILEAELARRKKTPSKNCESKSSADLSPRSPTNAKKARPSREYEDEPPPPARKSFMVTMKLSKRMAKQVQRLLALPPHKERSTSIDSQPAPSRKRPLPGSGGTITVDASDSVAVKRPRKSEASAAASKTIAPSTPQRSSICVSHHVNTPGEGGLDTCSQPKVLLANVPPNVEALKQRYERYKVLGTKLKHSRDHVVKNFPPTDGVRKLPDTELKLSTVTGIEAILSYMAGFNALSEARHLERKVKDHALWKSLLPLVNELQLSVREYVFPRAVLSILQEIVLQEIVTTLVVNGDFRNQHLVQEIRRVGREHEKVKRLLPSLFRQVEESNEEAAFPLELPVIYSGEPVEQAVSKTLLAIKAWAAKEKVEWEAKLSTDEILSGA